jgi:hypothetical protein
MKFFEHLILHSLSIANNGAMAFPKNPHRTRNNSTQKNENIPITRVQRHLFNKGEMASADGFLQQPGR